MLQSIALPPYLPDQTVNSGALLRADGVYAAIDGYRPIKAPVPASDGLPGPFMGGGSFTASDGTTYLLGATATGIYRLTSGIWTELATGLTSSGRWQFVQFGNFAVVVNGGPTLEVNLSTGVVTPIAGAPTGNSVAVVRNFVVIGRTNGNLLELRWSGQGNHLQWDAGINRSGFQEMHEGGAIMGIAGGEYGVVVQRNQTVRMTDVGTDFSFDVISPNIGAAAGESISQVGRSVFFLSDRGFIRLEDGQAIQPIGNEKIDRTFQGELARAEYVRLWAAIDPQNTLALWLNPGDPGKMWIYNWVLDRWTTASVSASAIFTGYTAYVTLEEVAALYPDLDAMPVSLDDPRFSGGDPRLYVMSVGNEAGAFVGPNLEARIDMGFTQLAPGMRARLSSIRPIGDMTEMTAIVDGRQRLGDAPDTIAAGALRASGIMPVRKGGRFISLCMSIAAGHQWGYLQSVEFEYERGGLR